MSYNKLNVVIMVTDEPIHINQFIKSIICKSPNIISKVYIVKAKIVRGKNSNRLRKLLSLGLIVGPFELIKILIIHSINGIFKKMKVNHMNPFAIEKDCSRYDIPVEYIDNVNDDVFLKGLSIIKPDIIVNQAQVILKNRLLSIPNIGTLNRHCALLPKYRGRLAPFWAYINKEKETGLSIHLIDEEIDNGPIVVQKRIPISRFDTVNSLIRRCFSIAPDAMLEALDILSMENYEKELINNEKCKATYFSSPGLLDSLHYWRTLIRRWATNE